MYFFVMYLCPTPTKRSVFCKITTLVLAALFLYLSLGSSEDFTLFDTVVATTIQAHIASWFIFVLELGAVLLLLVVLSLILHGIFHLASTHHISKRWLRRLRKTEIRMFKRTLNFTFLLVRWSIGVSIAYVVLVYILKPLSATTTLIHVPEYHLQPVIFVFGIFGIALIIEAFDFWPKWIHRRFCVRVK